MKCQKCGVRDVNFHYTSNINGNMTEDVHLCMQCAAQAGYNVNQMLGSKQTFDFGNLPMPDQMFNRSLSPTIGSIIAMFPYMMQQNIGLPENRNVCASGCGLGETASTSTKQNVEIDDEMRERRELKMQMNIAIESENFEKAAELRDRLKELEKVRAEGRATCDSETD